MTSRLGSLREKKSSALESNLTNAVDLKLTLIEQPQNNTYQPTSTFSRTSNRLLKGRIEKPPSNDYQQTKPNNLTEQKNYVIPPKLAPQEKLKDLKLVLNDSPQIQMKKTFVEQPKAPQKRILITKEPVKEQPIIETKIIQQKLPQPKIQERPIKVEVVEEEEDSKDLNQNDLIQCTEGCGRKFNRKALEKHAKACKLVFMSKRKQFNSQAKRITSKQQATILKQTKLKQKSLMGKTKTKGFQKTGQNWKLASEQFRAAIKGIKKQEGGENGEEEEKQQKKVSCSYCEMVFIELFLEQHLQNCGKKKQQQKKLAGKKKK